LHGLVGKVAESAAIVVHASDPLQNPRAMRGARIARIRVQAKAGSYAEDPWVLRGGAAGFRLHLDDIGAVVVALCQ